MQAQACQRMRRAIQCAALVTETSCSLWQTKHSECSTALVTCNAQTPSDVSRHASTAATSRCGAEERALLRGAAAARTLGGVATASRVPAFLRFTAQTADLMTADAKHSAWRPLVEVLQGARCTHQQTDGR